MRLCEWCSQEIVGKRSGTKCCSKKCVDARWKAANADYVKAFNAGWYVANADHVKASKAEWRAANADHAKASSAKWRTDNPEKMRAQQHRRRARKSSTVFQFWVKRDDVPEDVCYWCGTSDVAHVDHVMPISLGGPAVESNEVPTCAECNLSKGATHPLVWIAHLVSS